MIHEVRNDFRQLFDSYDIAYEYDQGGNRTKKIEQTNIAGTTIETTYTYDIEDPVLYLSKDNRLMKWRKDRVSQGGGQQSAMSGGGDPTTTSIGEGGETLVGGTGGGGGATAAPGGGGPSVTNLEEGWYYYVNDDFDDNGNAARVLTRTFVPGPGLDQFASTRLVYAHNGRAVSYVSGETWDYWSDIIASNPQNYDITYAREYRYDGARQRYLAREFDPADLMLSPPQFTTIAETWSDYDGNTIYGDFETWSGQGDIRSYSPGVGLFDWNSGAPDTSTAKYYHTDMIGTTRTMSDANGDPVEPAKYTAFGELVAGTSRRYGYAGVFGYQTDSTGDSPFMHVGARYYNPSTGRFVQRDAIGIDGGLNVYRYARSQPVHRIDPSGSIDRAPVHWQKGWENNPHFHETVHDLTGEGIKVGIGALVCLWAGGWKGAGAGVFLYWWWS